MVSALSANKLYSFAWRLAGQDKKEVLVNCSATFNTIVQYIVLCIMIKMISIHSVSACHRSLYVTQMEVAQKRCTPVINDEMRTDENQVCMKHLGSNHCAKRQDGTYFADYRVISEWHAPQKRRWMGPGNSSCKPSTTATHRKMSTNTLFW